MWLIFRIGRNFFPTALNIDLHLVWQSRASWSHDKQGIFHALIWWVFTDLLYRHISCFACSRFASTHLFNVALFPTVVANSFPEAAIGCWVTQFSTSVTAFGRTVLTEFVHPWRDNSMHLTLILSKGVDPLPTCLTPCRDNSFKLRAAASTPRASSSAFWYLRSFSDKSLFWIWLLLMLQTNLSHNMTSSVAPKLQYSAIECSSDTKVATVSPDFVDLL